MLYSNPFNTIISKTNDEAFVDDTAIGSTASSLEPNISPIQAMEKAAQKYEWYLFLFGSKLDLPKYKYHHISFKRTKTGKAAYNTIVDTTDSSIILTEVFTPNMIHI